MPSPQADATACAAAQLVPCSPGRPVALPNMHMALRSRSLRALAALALSVLIAASNNLSTNGVVIHRVSYTPHAQRQPRRYTLFPTSLTIQSNPDATPSPCLALQATISQCLLAMCCNRRTSAI